jgi:hypothetical protein
MKISERLSLNNNEAIHWIDIIERDEPFQSNLFYNLIQEIKADHPVMMEIGCAEAHYSAIFRSHFKNKCTNICIDVLPRQLVKAKVVCPGAVFYHGYAGDLLHIGETVEDDFGAKRYTVNQLIKENNIDKCNVLHIDAQGSEASILEEMKADNIFNKFQLLFVSVHSSEIYDKCMSTLSSEIKNNKIHFCDPSNGGCGIDGLIVIENLDLRNL